ncbi:hypothetical protein MHL39_10695 [Roseomonas mucosa]|nr:hypothetical protein [Roseomonas mucosa]
MTDNTSQDFAGLVNLKGIPLSDSGAVVSDTTPHASHIAAALSDTGRSMSDTLPPGVDAPSGQEFGA